MLLPRMMFAAKDIVVWINDGREFRPGFWADPIGAAYSEWQTMTDKQRVQLMLETVIDLAMQGFPLKDVLIALAQVREFRALGSQSYPMARALTSALLGKCLEPNTTSFEELLVRYGPMRSQAAEWGGEFGSTVRRQATPPLQVPLRGQRQLPGSPASPHRS